VVEMYDKPKEEVEEPVEFNKRAAAVYRTCMFAFRLWDTIGNAAREAGELDAKISTKYAGPCERKS
jgi:hypothetical protein